MRKQSGVLPRLIPGRDRWVRQRMLRRRPASRATHALLNDLQHLGSGGALAVVLRQATVNAVGHRLGAVLGHPACHAWRGHSAA